MKGLGKLGIDHSKAPAESARGSRRAPATMLLQLGIKAEELAQVAGLEAPSVEVTAINFDEDEIF